MATPCLATATAFISFLLQQLCHDNHIINLRLIIDKNRNGFIHTSNLNEPNITDMVRMIPTCVVQFIHLVSFIDFLQRNLEGMDPKNILLFIFVKYHVILMANGMNRCYNLVLVVLFFFLFPLFFCFVLFFTQSVIGSPGEW